MYAILSDRGRQYKVQEGDLLRVDRMTADAGAAVTFDKVLLVEKDGAVQVGTPAVAGATVSGVVEDHGKAEKVIAHHRVRTNSLGRRKGHRTQYTVVKITGITA